MRNLMRVLHGTRHGHHLLALAGFFPALPALAAPPANDHFANAAVLTTGTAVTGTNVDATLEAGEMAPPNYDPEDYARTVWWNWTAPASGVYEISTAGSDFDTVLAVWTGSAVNALTLVTENDQGGLENTSRLRFSTVGGTVYHIAVAGWGETETGKVILKASVGPPPPSNDHFASRTALTIGTEWTGSLDGATRETGEPNPPLVDEQDTSVWFTWTAPSTGWFEFTQNDYYNLTVWTGSTLPALRYIHGGDEENLRIKAVAGTVYQISLAQDEGGGFAEDDDSTLVIRAAEEPEFQITSFTLSQSSVDVTSAEQTVTAVFTAKGGGLPQQYASLQIEGNDSFDRSIDLTAAHLVSGTAAEGTYSVSIPFQRGLWPDQLWFNIWWGSSNLTAGIGREMPFLMDSVPSLELRNTGLVDDEEGAVLSLTSSSVSVDITESARDISFTVRASDALSGVRRVDVALVQGNPEDSWWRSSIQLSRTSGTAQDGTYTGVLQVDNDLRSGTYAVGVSVRDFNDNYDEFISWDEAFPGPFRGNITVIRNERTKILSFTTSPDPVNVSTAGQEVTATFRVAAVANGTVDSTLWLTFDADGLPGGAGIPELYVTSQNRISGDEKDGTYQVKFMVPVGMPPGPLQPRMRSYYDNSDLNFSSGEIHGWAHENDYNYGPTFPWPAAVQQALQVVNTGTVDSQAPVLTRISLPTHVMSRKENGEWTLNGTMTITDNLDLGPNIRVFLTDSTGDDENGYSSFVRNPDNSLSVTLTAYEDNDDYDEIFYLGVEVTDTVGNQRLYISSQADFPGPFKGPVIFPQTGASGYASWRTGAFDAAAAADASISGEAADPDRDGVSNLMEYALGLAPTAPDAAGVPELVREGANTYFRYTRIVDRPDLSFLVQSAATPAGPWSPANLTPVSTVPQGTRQTETLAVPAAGRGFLRLQVNK